MSVSYHCPHTQAPHPPYPPSYPSSSSSFSPLPSLFFCEECDSIRCDQCVAIEIASYFCPNCLFDVPSANVRADRNRCARSCFSCPSCTSALQTIATETMDPSSSAATAGPPFLLFCPGCKWSSREVGLEFEKGTGIASQLAKINKEIEGVQNEFEALKDHLDGYVTATTPAPPALKSALAGRQPTRHISHLTQMAAKALGRDVPGMRSVRPRKSEADREVKVNDLWDEMEEYTSRATWRARGVERGMSDVEEISALERDVAMLKNRWDSSWERSRDTSALVPERIPLHTKLTKRCPDSSCRHLLIQPDTKSTRFKIKMVASNYLPELELGRRRRRLVSGDMDQPMTPEEMERRRRERRRTRARGGDEEDEPMSRKLRAGDVYTFQMAFTNPLYDPIQIRLTQPIMPKNAPPANHHLHIPTQHFTVNAFKDAWAYDEDEEDEDVIPGLEGSEGLSEEGSAFGTLGRRSRKSLLVTGSMRDKKKSDGGVEKKGNVSKVGLEVEVSQEATGRVDFDLEVRYTYRAEDAGEKSKDGKGTKEEYKTFTYWVRVNVGEIE